MDRYIAFVIKRKKPIVVLFIALTVTGIFLWMGVKINYNMVDYLPDSAQSTQAVKIMEEQFTQSIPNANVMIGDVSLAEALEYKREISALDAVSEVLWLDDTIDIKKPLGMYDSGTVEAFYKNNTALISVTIERGREAEGVAAIRSLIGEQNAVSGDAADVSSMQETTSAEVMNAVIIIVPAILLILILSTKSWIEPLLFIAAIGASILINMGTNIFLGDISFVTNSVSPILQLAVSLDYAIFLLHSFAGYRTEADSIEEAMKWAMKKSIKAVAASAVTTLFGFLALTFMDFGIGADLGINLAKGIVLSFVACMVFLPALTLLCYRIIDHTQHKEFLPSFQNINRVLSKLAIPVLVIVAVLTLPSFLGQSRTRFTYGNTVSTPSSRSARETLAIRDVFGQSTVIALLVPRGDIVNESGLTEELKGVKHVTGVVSFTSSVGTGIPSSFLDDGITGRFYSEEYARIILYTDTPNEGEVAFSTVESVHEKVRKFYGDEFYSVGQSTNLYDMKNVVSVDNTKVNLIAIIAIFLVLVVTFRSAVLPFLLLFTIEIGIWINLSIPYFTGNAINFLGYLVISTVQLGATVDYAILLTSYYLDSRKLMGQKEAISKSLVETFKSILMSGVVQMLSGLALGLTSSNPIVSGLGLLLARGTLLSMLMVFCLLPALLRIFDGWIGAITFRANFYRHGGLK